MAKIQNLQPTPEQYGRVIRDIIEERGLKHALVADEANMSAGTLSSIVNGKLGNEKAIARHINKLCIVLNVDFADLQKRALYEGCYGLASARFGMSLGETLSLWSGVLGDGKTALKNKDVQMSFDRDAEIILPPSIELLVARTLQEQAAGKHTFKNNSVLTIFDASWFPFEGEDERPGINLSLGKTSYALLYALRHTEKGQQFLSETLDDWEPKQEIDPVLGQGLGVSVAILSNDGHFIFGRRFSKIGARAEEIDTGAVEGLGLMDVVDNNNTGIGNIDIQAVMERAANEEFGITNSKIKSLKILGFGFDIGWSQWNFIGLCETDLTGKEIQARHRSVASQRAEYKETHAVKSDPDILFNWLADEPRAIWSCGLGTIFYAMVHLHGIDKVEDALRGLSFKISHNLVWG